MTWWHEFVPRDGIVYDVGANVGDTVREFASLARVVYAFEPNPMCFKELRKATAGLKNVHLLSLGLSNHGGEVRVFTYRHWLLLPANDSDPRYANPNYHPGQRADLKGEFSVCFTTLDRLVRRRFPKPGFIKIDVDGMEWAVLDGALDLLLRYQPILYLELGVYAMKERGDEAERVTTLLSRCEYEFVVDFYGSPLRATEHMLLDLASGFDHDTNVLCVPRGDERIERWSVPSKDFY